MSLSKNYQFISLEEIINQFIVAYVGEDKLIPKAKRLDVAFHAQRALAELSFDTLKSFKAIEVTIPPSLQIQLPNDYVNYTKISSVDSAGIKHPLYPNKNTSNPQTYYQNDDGEFKIDLIGTLTDGSNVVVLDKDYSGVLINGMKVDGLNLTATSYIHDITTTDGVTSITLKNQAGDASQNATATTNQQLSVSRIDLFGQGKLRGGAKRLGNQELVETTATAITNTNVNPTVVNVASVGSIKVGMFISHPAFSNNQTATKVIGVGTSTVELSNPVDTNKEVAINDTIGFITNDPTSTTWDSYSSHNPSENNQGDYQDYQNDVYWPNHGQRYGLDPSESQINGSFYIDEYNGKIHFSSNVSGEKIIIDYISDSLGTENEMQVHKFAEEAMYKHIVYAMLSTRANVQEYIIRRFKRERFAETRKAKLRLSNIKLEEITQTLRGQSKHIKH